jgi:hypothetical protein
VANPLCFFLFPLYFRDTTESFACLSIAGSRKRDSFQSLRALTCAVSGGADAGEVLSPAYRIREGDDESWYREWIKTVERCEKAGDDFLA